MRQARAEETRSTLLLAAAYQFDRHGYEGTSLLAISDLAAVSKGALSFHFSNKFELADAVQYLACTRIRDELEELTAPDVPGLQTLIDMTYVAGHRLATDPLPRASLRLARERGTTQVPALDCRVTLRDALQCAAVRGAEDRSLRIGVSADSLVDLGLALVVHQETVGAEPSHTAHDREAWLTQVWQLLLPTLAPDGHPWTFRAEGLCTPAVS